jgi:VanZ family protein
VPFFVLSPGFIFSLTIETDQYFIPQRKPSGSDLVLNAVESLAGGAIAAAARQI